MCVHATHCMDMNIYILNIYFYNGLIFIAIFLISNKNDHIHSTYHKSFYKVPLMLSSHI